MGHAWYILNEDHTYSEVGNMHEYYAWDKDYGFYGLKEDRKTIDRYESKNLVVSTVFLGLDHSFEGPPILFETLVSGGDLEGEMDRYHTWEEAIKGHNNMMKLCGIEVKKKKKETNNIIDNRFDILDL
jgi:hypothetical protein